MNPGQRRETETTDPRRLLMIALDFPPVATSGSFRLAGFARYLPEHAWATSVVTTRHAFYGDAYAGTSENSLPEDCEVIRAFGFDTKTALSYRGRYPAVLSFPDRAASWVADGIRRALHACRNRRIDAVLSSSPPVSAHVIAYAVKRVTRLPWIADLRDPWNLDVPRGALLQRLDRQFERRLLAAADRITVAAAGMIGVLKQQHHDVVGSKIRLVTNGYDEELMAAALADVERPASFNIAHTGSCTGSYRNPATFFQAVRLCLDRGELPAAISIDLIGSQDDAAVREDIRRLRLDNHVRSHDRVTQREALKMAARAAVLLVLQTRSGHDRCIPTKVYEYLRTDRAILGIVRDGSDAADLLRAFDGVTRVPPTDVEAIAAALTNLHRAWAAGKSGGFKRDVARYSRRSLTADLAAVLDEVSTPAEARRA